MDMTTETPSDVCIPKMDMSLHWSTCEWILVRSWKADTTGKFICAVIVIFLTSIAYEGLKYYREVLFNRHQKAWLQISNQNPNIKQMFKFSHGIQTCLHGLQVVTSYLLMLIVMLANMYLILTVCFGAAIGYFFFGWLRKKNIDQNECCY